jgi:hypothetical protein
MHDKRARTIKSIWFNLMREDFATMDLRSLPHSPDHHLVWSCYCCELEDCCDPGCYDPWLEDGHHGASEDFPEEAQEEVHMIDEGASGRYCGKLGVPALGVEDRH